MISAAVLVALNDHRLPVWALIPWAVGGLVALLADYRGKHGFWPWDRKRRKIERYGWLIEAPVVDQAEREAQVERFIGWTVIRIVLTLMLLTFVANLAVKSLGF